MQKIIKTRYYNAYLQENGQSNYCVMEDFKTMVFVFEDGILLSGMANIDWEKYDDFLYIINQCKECFKK